MTELSLNRGGADLPLYVLEVLVLSAVKSVH